MPKKITQKQTKTKLSLAERLANIDKLCADAEKNGMAIAGRVCVNPRVAERLNIEFIPTPSMDINEALGGGLPRSRISIVSGDPNSGKTGLLLESIGRQMDVDPEFIAVWIDTEHNLPPKDKMEKVYHIDFDRFIYLEQNYSSGGEGLIDSLIFVMNSDVEPDIVVINSLKLMVPKALLGRPMDKDSIGKQASFNAKAMQKLVPIFAASRTALCMVQDLTTDIGVLWGDNKVMAGGQAIRYAASIIIDLRKNAIQDSDPVPKEGNMKVKLRVRKNHCIIDRNPYVELEYFIEIGKGIEQVFSILNDAIKTGIMAQRGAWLYILDKDGNKQDDWSWQGRAAFKSDMEANPDKLEKIKQMIGGGIVESMSEEEIAILEKAEVDDEKATALIEAGEVDAVQMES